MTLLHMHFYLSCSIFWTIHISSLFILSNSSDLFNPSGNPGIGQTSTLGVSRIRRKRYISAREMSALLGYHNQVRAQVSPPAANMEYMVWDERLARSAEAWAKQCIWGHGPPQLMKFIGQNLAIHSGRYHSVVDLVKSWYYEKQHYSFPYPYECKPRCPSKCNSSVCSHYTQSLRSNGKMCNVPLTDNIWSPPLEASLKSFASNSQMMVWASSNRIGCAIHTCTNINMWGNTWRQAVYLVCNYAIRGNWVGEAPYKIGRPCSACPPHYGGSCSSNMCHFGSPSNRVGWF